MAAILRGLPEVGDADLQRITHENPGWKFERDERGALLVSPTLTLDGARSGEAFYQLKVWSKRAGGKAFDSSTGFKITAKSVRSPDASWVSSERIATLSAEQLEEFWPICPDVVIEVASTFDAWDDVVQKIHMFFDRGARYAIAIDPRTREVFALGEPPPGLVLDIQAIIEG